jgi:hypothetical protein
MFQQLEGMMQKVVSGEIDQQSVGQAADEHVSSMDAGQLTQHVQTAANNAQQNGDTGLAAQLTGLLEQYRSNPQNLKGELVSLITNNPQVLQHFAPEFAKNILGKI